jgi:hypothetical protein
MPNTKTTSLDGHIKLCVYGAPGTGKTHFSGTFPRPYLFDFGTEHRTLIGLDIEYDQYSSNPKTAQDTIRQVNLKINDLWSKMVTKDAAGKFIARPDSPFDTIIFDNLSFFSDLLMHFAIQTRSSKEAANADPDKPTQGEWYEVQNKVIATIQTLLAFPANVLFIAHHEAKQDKEGNIVWGRPLVAGKLGEKLDALFDEFYHSEVAPGPTPVYLLRTQTQFPWRAKSRSAGPMARLGQPIPAEIKPPNFQSIVAFMKKAEEKGTV